MKLAIVRVRGQVHVRHDIRRTLEQFGLKKKNHCAVVEDGPSVKGMLAKAQHFVTWGPVTGETMKALEKRGGKNVFRLNPPKKGYGKKGVKMPFKLGGALGDRAEKINDLVMRMV